METAEIGRKLRDRRIECEWSQEDLAERTGLSPVYIGMIERGEKTPRLETFVKIINTLDVSSDEILEDVLTQGFKIKMTKYTEAIEKLEPKDQKRILAIIDAYLKVK